MEEAGLPLITIIAIIGGVVVAILSILQGFFKKRNRGTVNNPNQTNRRERIATRRPPAKPGTTTPTRTERMETIKPAGPTPTTKPSTGWKTYKHDKK